MKGEINTQLAWHEPSKPEGWSTYKDGDRWWAKFLGLYYTIELYQQRFHVTVDILSDGEPLGCFEAKDEGFEQAKQACQNDLENRISQPQGAQQ